MNVMGLNFLTDKQLNKIRSNVAYHAYTNFKQEVENGLYRGDEIHISDFLKIDNCKIEKPMVIITPEATITNNLFKSRLSIKDWINIILRKRI
jgi:hypothetical protein